MTLSPKDIEAIQERAENLRAWACAEDVALRIETENLLGAYPVDLKSNNGTSLREAVADIEHLLSHISDLRKENERVREEEREHIWPPLARIEGDEVVIRFSIDAIPQAAEVAFENECYGIDPATGEPEQRVIDARGFAADMVRALTREEEDGTTAVHLLLDKAVVDACEAGSEHIEEIASAIRNQKEGAGDLEKENGRAVSRLASAESLLREAEAFCGQWDFISVSSECNEQARALDAWISAFFAERWQEGVEE